MGGRMRNGRVHVRHINHASALESEWGRTFLAKKNTNPISLYSQFRVKKRNAKTSFGGAPVSN
jgi:hypothetical protein